jgi:predicted ribosomally synthesized peptide with SipW-like signal peptide
MKKVLFAIMAIVLCVGLIGGAFAYFTDTQASTGNTFTSGFSKLSISNGVSGYQHGTNVVIGTAGPLSPGGAAVGPYTVGLENDGNINGIVTAKVTYGPIVNVAGSPVGTANADQFASKLVVATAYADGGSLNVAPYFAQQIAALPGVGWANAEAWGYTIPDSNGISGMLPTIYGLAQITLHWTNGYNGPDINLAPGQAHWEVMTLKFDKSADNAYENESLSITITGTLTSN